MAGIKLDELKQEIDRYVGIPYQLGGKLTWTEIQSQANQLIASRPSTPKQLYNQLKKHHIGIDCSGLVFHLLTFIAPNLESKLIGTENKMGVRRLSSDLLTSPINSVPINSYDDIQTGDLIRVTQGRHVIFVIEKVGNTINYVHNSNHTQNRGVHYGTITITNPHLTLEHQIWSDTQLDGQPYSALFNPALGDGIYRIKHL